MVLKNSKDFKSKKVEVRGYYIAIVFLMLIMLDRVTKIWASGLNKEIDHGIIAFTTTINTGAGFSILQDMNMALAILSVIVLIAIIYLNKHIPKFSLATISAGIVGNLIDRISYGGVIDFINFKFWPIFNIADSLICIGAIYWIIVMWKEEKNKDSKTETRPAVHPSTKRPKNKNNRNTVKK
jgi:signal peptidase II